ncbi:MAG: dockerin type I repeat-containing protein [Clostridia bacterium]|nr:dockerin type I repeat-containing protein [Clostridia bacterium]
MKTRRILAAFVAALLAVLTVSSAFAAPVSGTKYATPNGLNDNDYQKLVAFLETADGDGVKNGFKLNPDYDPEDVMSWAGVMWTGDEDDRIGWLFLGDNGLVGSLDLSGFAMLEHLDCSGNMLTELTLTGCLSLEYLATAGNHFTSLDLTGPAALPCFKKLAAVGSGAVEAAFQLGGWFYATVTAVPDAGSAFAGWYSVSDGTLVSSEPSITVDPDVLMSGDPLPDMSDIEARFVIIGDADGNGHVEATDALLVLRMAMGIIDTPADTTAFDADGNGSVEATDALLILRFAMGIITEF